MGVSFSLKELGLPKIPADMSTGSPSLFDSLVKLAIVTEKRADRRALFVASGVRLACIVIVFGVEVGTFVEPSGAMSVTWPQWTVNLVRSLETFQEYRVQCIRTTSTSFKNAVFDAGSSGSCRPALLDDTRFLTRIALPGQG